MSRRKAQIFLALAILILTFSLLSCSKKGEYADDIPCSELMDAVEDQIPLNFGYETFDSDHCWS